MTTTVIYISGNYPHALRFFSFSQQDFNMMMMMMMIKRLIIDENKMKNKNEKKLNSEFNRTNWKKKEKISLNHWLTHWSNNEKHETYFFRFFMFDFFALVRFFIEKQKPDWSIDFNCVWFTVSFGSPFTKCRKNENQTSVYSESGTGI